MSKYSVIAIIDASKYVGTFEAESKEEAIENAEENAETPTLCHQCSGDLDLGDIIKFEANEEKPQ